MNETTDPGAAHADTERPLVLVGFGGGCHWCTEAVFQPLKGVVSVAQGFIRSDPPDDTWSEAVEVVFDPDGVDLRDLIAVHLATHASTSDHKMRGKYRSAIYAHNPSARQRSARLIRELSREADLPVVTRALTHRGFKPSDPRFHDYYRSDPQRPFCQSYIEPKLAKLRARYATLLKETA